MTMISHSPKDCGNVPATLDGLSAGGGHIENNICLEERAMNTGLKNKLLVLAAAAGLAGFGVGCGGDAPAAEEGATEESAGGEGSCSGAEEAAPAEGEAAPAEGGEAAPAEGAAEGGEGSCG
jgi:hypothetical protein